MKDRLNALTEQIIGVALNVHDALGTGLLESAYEKCTVFDLVRLGLDVEEQKPVPLVYRGETIPCAFRADIVVNREVIVEVKSVEYLTALHRAQMLSYLRLTGCRVGLILNFNAKFFTRDGIRRVVNNFPEE